MNLTEIFNITRIVFLDESVNRDTNIEIKGRIRDSLDVFALRAKDKYSNGFMGMVRKITSMFFNLFTSNSVVLFYTIPDRAVSVSVYNNSERKYSNCFIDMVSNCFMDMVKKITQIFFKPAIDARVLICSNDRCILPWFIGCDADFARLIQDTVFAEISL